MHRPLHRLTILSLAIAIAAACAPRDDAADAGPEGGATDTAAVADAQGDFAIADAVFATPESVFWDEQADMYYVSNINGAPAEKDGNGFITRVRPDGTIDTPRWIDGASADVTLHAPKGMAARGDTLWVTDIDTVRAFNRTTGQPIGAHGVEGATFLNDLATAADGTLYVTDMGVDASFQPNGRAAIYQVDAQNVTAVARGDWLNSPNGIIAVDGAIILVPFGGAAVMRVPLDGSAPDTLAVLPGGQLDGVIQTHDGDVLVSSWESSSVYRIDASGNVSVFAADLESPADIGYDARRNRVLVPLFNLNRVEVRTIPE